MRYRFASAAALLLLLLAKHAAGQPVSQDGTVLPTGRDLDLRYVGSATRLGIGYNTRDKLRGDAYQVFGETEQSAWIGELWLSERSAAGAQLSYHWQPEGSGKDVFVHISAVERAGLSTLNEGATVDYEIVSDRGKESAGNLKVRK